MVSQVQPQEETEERPRKTKFIICTGPRSRRHSTCQATWERRQGGQAADDRRGEHLGRGLYWSFLCKGKAGQEKQFGIG